MIIETTTLQASACTRSRVITYKLVGSMEQCMWKKGYSTTVIIETATLQASTCTSSRVITYQLDSSSWIHGAMHVEERVEYHSDHRDCYMNSASKHMHKQ